MASATARIDAPMPTFRSLGSIPTMRARFSSSVMREKSTRSGWAVALEADGLKKASDRRCQGVGPEPSLRSVTGSVAPGGIPAQGYRPGLERSLADPRGGRGPPVARYRRPAACLSEADLRGA